MYLYNAFIIALLGGFMYVTQQKIIASLTARTFLENLTAAPLTGGYIMLTSLMGLGALFLLSLAYRMARSRGWSWKYAIIFVEIIACIVIMHSLNMAYDGVILLVVADLMYGYRGTQQRILLLAAIAGIYLIVNYNFAVFQFRTVPLEAYAAYYNLAAQNVLKAGFNILTALNMAVFILYVLMMVQNEQREKERIKSLNQQLNEANERLRAYAIEAEYAAETRERNRLAREIHDTLGHALTGIAAGIDACIATFDSAPDFSKKQLSMIRSTAQRGIVDVRRSVKKLKPSDLDRLPLYDALLEMIEGFMASTGMKIAFHSDCVLEGMRDDEEEVIYRIVQESVTNANQHGKATWVKINISRKNDELVIKISDNGKGCENIVPSFGLRHMKERVELLKGRVFYKSEGGFQIEAVIPASRGGDKS
jgi:signal transduction histidine kinase